MSLRPYNSLFILPPTTQLSFNMLLYFLFSCQCLNLKRDKERMKDHTHHTPHTRARSREKKIVRNYISLVRKWRAMLVTRDGVRERERKKERKYSRESFFYERERFQSKLYSTVRFPHRKSSQLGKFTFFERATLKNERYKKRKASFE